MKVVKNPLIICRLCPLSSPRRKKLAAVLVSNGYPFSFLQKLIKTRRTHNSAEPTNEFKSTVGLPYVKGLSKQLHSCLQQQGVCCFQVGENGPEPRPEPRREKRESWITCRRMLRTTPFFPPKLVEQPYLERDS